VRGHEQQLGSSMCWHCHLCCVAQAASRPFELPESKSTMVLVPHNGAPLSKGLLDMFSSAEKESAHPTQ
jgi:hypothetical protein